MVCRRGIFDGGSPVHTHELLFQLTDALTIAPPIETCTEALRRIRFVDPCTITLPPNVSERADDPGAVACCAIETLIVDMQNSCVSRQAVIGVKSVDTA
jgi:hypothetical protein